jgi:hypothetical protein
MKNKYISLLLLSAVLVSGSCKKAEDDPFLSFRSRKDRVTGEWKTTSGSGSFQGNPVHSWSYDGTTMTRKDGPAPAETSKESYNYVFSDDGNFVITQTNFGSDDDHAEIIDRGTWNFTGGEEGSKSKSRLILIFESTAELTHGFDSLTNIYTSYTGNSYTRIYDIMELRNNKMRIARELSADFNNSGQPYFIKEEWTLEK